MAGGCGGVGVGTLWPPARGIRTLPDERSGGQKQTYFEAGKRQIIATVSRRFCGFAMVHLLTICPDATQTHPGVVRAPGDGDGTVYADIVVGRDSGGAGDPSVLRRPASLLLKL